MIKGKEENSWQEAREFYTAIKDFIIGFKIITNLKETDDSQEKLQVSHDNTVPEISLKVLHWYKINDQKWN